MNLRPTLIVAILVSISIVSVESVLEKSIIKYLGTSFLVRLFDPVTLGY